jgi:hypothetical protein
MISGKVAGKPAYGAKVAAITTGAGSGRRRGRSSA